MLYILVYMFTLLIYNAKVQPFSETDVSLVEKNVSNLENLKRNA